MKITPIKSISSFKKDKKKEEPSKIKDLPKGTIIKDKNGKVILHKF
jgi:hypothetical protein